MLDQDKILNFLKVTGPTLPTKVAKNINTDILLASAHLSDLSSQGKVKISKLKIGGSPLYFLPGQESQLYDFASGNINSKDLLVLDQLKEKNILRESNLELIQRVGLRNLPDFAVPLNVRVGEEIELFWKWHLLSNDEANQMIGTLLTGVKETVTAPLEEVPEVEEKVEEQIEEVEETKQEAEVVVGKEKPEVVEEIKQEPEASIKEEAKPIEEEELKEKEEIKSVTESKDSESSDKPAEVKEEVKIKEEKQKKLTEEKKVIEEKKELEQKKESIEEKKPFLQKVKEKIIRKKKKVVEDEFSPQVQVFFDGLRILTENKDVIRKNSEINYSVKVPSAVGHIIYFCKAKSKSKCDEKDISAAYMEAQVKKLPLLFLYTNEITKKAEEMLESGVFENVVVRKINNGE
ncbi:hypothetical protein HON71_04780 [Candidatus Woesearchaeota archaeon]|jgi:hypothetical protein|nr:hypothetical protein [Candidatus Woesearchaeota archaeon]MBT5342663.1 hypothetical protein [Candidatus Woesearchaeota archaeon]